MLKFYTWEAQGAGNFPSAVNTNVNAGIVSVVSELTRKFKY
jgi:hypothetical protein